MKYLKNHKEAISVKNFMVVLTRLELVTSPLSGVHSNQLSYRT